MTPDLDDTIAAIASAPGPAVRGIVRVAGPSVSAALGAIFVPDDAERWKSAWLPLRHAGRIPLGGVDLPVAVFLWPTARSYAGQPMAELHTVGSPPLLDLVVQKLCDRGARPAGRGEFTLRAFLAGRLDLVRAEAVLGVIDADDHVELERALRQLGGGVSASMQRVREDLVDLLADLEAGLDFVDEDIEFVPAAEVVRRLTEAERFVADLLDRSAGRMQSTGRRVVVLAGLPNAGKSTLFNRLAGAGRALVSNVAGTTRDWLTAEIDLAGLTVELVDTAGWENVPEARLLRRSRTTTDASFISDSHDTIDTTAGRLRRAQLERADLVVWCTSTDLEPGLVEADERIRATIPGDVIRLGTKADLRSATADDPERESSVSPELVISETDPDSIDHFGSLLHERLVTPTGDRGELLATTSARCRESLLGARDSLERALDAARSGAGDELVSLEARAALDHLGIVLGVVHTDDLLDRVFSKFCIGK